MDFHGFSVTIPHKESILPFLDDIDSTTKKIGAINTVVNKDGKLTGYNTDCMAAVKGLEGGLEGNKSTLKDKKIAIIGAGGAARAIAFGLKEKGCDITIYNRTLERAKRLSNDVGCKYRRFEEISELNTDILINSTSIGMFPNVEESPVPKAVLKKDNDWQNLTAEEMLERDRLERQMQEMKDDQAREKAFEDSMNFRDEY